MAHNHMEYSQSRLPKLRQRLGEAEDTLYEAEASGDEAKIAEAKLVVSALTRQIYGSCALA